MPATNEPQTAVEFSSPSDKNVIEAVEEFQKGRKAKSRFTKLPPNLAKRYEEVVKPFHDVAWKHLQTIVNSQEREDLEEYLKNADAKWRVAKDQENRYRDDSTQKQSTLSHSSSGQFYKTCRIISAGQCSILFSNPDELPVQYEPFKQSDDYTDDEGQRIADGQNAYLAYCWGRQNWTEIIKHAIRFNVKNSMQLLSMEWDEIEQMMPERVPGWYDKEGKEVEWNPRKGNHNGATMYDAEGTKLTQDFLDEKGMPTSYVFVEKLRVKYAGPVLEARDLSNTFFYLNVNDIQKSPIIVVRDQVPFSVLLDAQKNKLYENVEFIGDNQLYRDEARLGLTTLEDRKSNASEGNDDGSPNGLYDRYHIYMFSNIKDNDDPKKAEWDNDAIPTIHEAVYIGPFGEISALEDGVKAKSSVCVQVRKNPYHHGRYPYYLGHSHDDEKGLLRLGYYTVLECNVEEQTVTTDQWIDNKTLAIKSPFIGEKGNVLDPKLMFSANKVLWVKAGTGRTALQKLEVPNFTQRLVEEMNFLKQEADEIVGTMDVYKGQYAGARTTASEVMQVQTQAMKPALEETKFVAVPMLQWIAEMTALLGRQFHNPTRELSVMNAAGEFVGEVNPALLYGELQTKVTAVDNFEADIAARQLYINFIQAGGYDRAVQHMGKDGALYFWRMFAKRFKMDNPEKMFPESKVYVEAINQANADYQYMLINPVDAMNNPNYLPKMGEMHDVHIATLTPYRDRTSVLINTMPEEEKEHARLVLAALDLYIMMHEQLKQQEASMQGVGGQLGPGSQQPPLMLGPGNQGSALQSAETPEMPGEAQGDMLAGIGGQIAQ